MMSLIGLNPSFLSVSHAGDSTERDNIQSNKFKTFFIRTDEHDNTKSVDSAVMTY